MTAVDAPARYRVTAACVSVKTSSMGPFHSRTGVVVVMLYRGSVLPADVPAAQIARLLSLEMIEEV